MAFVVNDKIGKNFVGVVVDKANIGVYAAAKFGATGAERPHLKWLTMMPMADACMFCPTPKGETCMFMANPWDYDSRFGYLTCKKCEEKARMILDELHTKSQKLLEGFLDKFVVVQRSNGTLEHDWKIMKTCDLNPFTIIGENLSLYVRVSNGTYEKNIPLDKFIGMNRV